MHYARVRMILGCQDNGMARPSPCSSNKTGGLRSVFGNASACFGIWGSGFESPVRRWHMPIRNSRQHIKKVHDLAHDDRFDVWAVDEVRFEQHGSACRMCGFRRKSPILSYCIIPPAKESATLVLCASGTASSYTSGKKKASTGRRSSPFSSR